MKIFKIIFYPIKWIAEKLADLSYESWRNKTEDEAIAKWIEYKFDE